MGLRLRLLREQKGVSGRGLAELAGIGFSTVHRIETGKRKARVETIERLAKALEVSVRDLIEK
jgi:transcriptional regulator with XRE-family HTH domain